MARLPKICRHLHLPVQSGSTRVLEAMRRRYTRESYLDAGREDPRHAAGRGAVDRYDRRVSGRDRRGLRGHAVVDRGGRLSQHVLVQVLAAAATRSPISACADDVTDEEKTRRIVALQALQRDDSDRRSTQRLVGREVEVLVDAASRRRDTELSGRTSGNVVVNLPGPAGVDRADRPRPGRARRAAQRLGTAGLSDWSPLGSTRTGVLGVLSGKLGPMQIEMTIKGLMVDPITNMPIIILRDKEGQKVLPIWVGIFEANAIALQIENISTPRPMTHDLLRNVIQDLKASVQKIVVCDLQENTFYALIYLSLHGETVAIDARPSDAIALALRTRAPIFVEDDGHRPREDRRLLGGEGRHRSAAEVAGEPRSGRPGQIQDVRSRPQLNCPVHR